MARARSIASDINEDEFVGSLSFFERLAWIGLIVSVADDQGRMMANRKVICSKVFPYDENVTGEKIEESIQKFLQSGKLIHYADDKGRTYYQIVNWWRYQNQQWPQPSKFPAPEGWVDRIRYHAAGGKIVSEHWDSKGGLGNGLPSPLPSPLPSGQGRKVARRIKEREVEREGEREEEGETAVSSSTSSLDSSLDTDSFKTLVESASWTPSTPKEAEEHPAIKIFQEATGGRIPGSKDYELAVSWVVQIAQKHHVNGKDLPAYLNRWFTTWCSRKRADGKPYDPGNIAWMEWAYNGEAPPERSPGKQDGSANQFPTAYDAWGEARKAMAQFGHTREPEWENPITRKTVEALGWQELCMSTNQASDRARFVDCYNEYLRRELAGDTGLAQIQDLAKKKKADYGNMRLPEEESDV